MQYLHKINLINERLLFILFFLFAVSSPSFCQQTESTPTASSTPISTPAVQEVTPEQQINNIKATQKTVAEQLKVTKESLAKIASGTEQAELRGNLTRQVELLQTLDNTYNQQVSALEHRIAQETEQKRLIEEIERLKTGPPQEEPYSFIELDRLRDELNVQQARKETIDTKIQLAQSAVEQAQKSLEEARSRQKEVQAKLQSAEQTDQSDPAKALQTAQLAVRVAEENRKLQELELANRKLEKTVFQANLDLIQQKIKVMVGNLAFSKQDLDNRLLQIQKDKNDINKDLNTANDLKDVVKRRLDQARDKQLQNPDSDTVAEEVKARQLEWSLIQTRIENNTKKLELLEKRKTAWQQRYSAFNFEVDKNQLEKWKTEARNYLDTLEQDQKLLNLRFNERQSELVTLQTRINSAAEESAEIKKWLQAQQNNLQQLIGQLHDLQNNIEITRRVHQKLIDEINHITASLTLEERIDAFLALEFYENTVYNWLLALSCLFIIFISLFFIRWFLVRRLRKYSEKEHVAFAHFFLESVQRSKPFFFLAIAILAGSQFLSLETSTRDIVKKIAVIALIIQMAIWTSYFVRSWIMRYLAKKSKRDSTSMGALSIFNFLSQTVIWTLAFILALDNMEYDVTALVAGLGVGGIAVALALQKILGDLFASLSIVLDKPFVIGDFIIFDNYNFLGSVEYIGLKTTRLRSLSGEQIICSNSDLLETRIRNFKRMYERRVVFTVGVVYQTPYEKVAAISPMLKEIVESQSNVRFDRAHFKSFGDFALLYEIVYYVLDPDYATYMNIQQAINLEIYRRFDEQDIEFAYPTQSIHLVSSSTPQETYTPEAPPLEIPPE